MSRTLKSKMRRNMNKAAGNDFIVAVDNDDDSCDTIIFSRVGKSDLVRSMCEGVALFVNRTTFDGQDVRIVISADDYEAVYNDGGKKTVMNMIPGLNKATVNEQVDYAMKNKTCAQLNTPICNITILVPGTDDFAFLSTKIKKGTTGMV